MWLILCASSDISALWAYEGLQARGPTPLELVSAELLAYSLRWKHELGANGVSVSISLADGRTIRNDIIHGVINRLSWMPLQQSFMVNPSDRSYATQEFTAFFLSWLYALPQPVLNRPTPQGLAGQWRHISEWVWLASESGLPTSVYRQTGHEQIDQMSLNGRLTPPGTPVRTVIVVEGHVVGEPAPPDIRQGCQRFAELAETALLGIEFVVNSTGRWSFVGATPLPDLRLGGQALLDVLASVLQEQ